MKRVPLSKDNAYALGRSSVTHTERDFPSLVVFSTGDATASVIGGAVGGAIAGASGDKSINEQIKSVGTPNPNNLFEEMITEHLKAEFQLTKVLSEGIVLKGKKQRLDLENSEIETMFVLDSSVSWMCSYLPMNWTRYMFQFHFFVTITDADTQTIIYSERFHWKTPKSIGFPKMKEFLTDKDKGIEAQIRAACIDASEHFKSQLKSK